MALPKFNRSSNEIIDQKLIGRQIIRLDDYKNNTTHMSWQCLDCGNIWQSTSNNVVNMKCGCPKCVAKKFGKSDEAIDELMIPKNIKRLEPYTHRQAKIQWQCLSCSSIFVDSVECILKRKRPCKYCSTQKHGNAQYTNDFVDHALHDKSIKRLEDVVNANTKIHWQCLECDNIWITTPIKVLTGRKTGCPSCAAVKRNDYKRISNEQIDKRLLTRNIIRVDDIVNVDKPITWKCTTCQYQWQATPNNVTKIGSGCPRCSGRLKLTNSIIDERIIDRHMTRLGQVMDGATSILWKCHKCEHEWMASPDCVTGKSQTGCPRCNKVISKIETEWLDYKKIPNDPEHRQVRIKIGNKNYKVDGYIKETNTIYEFWGDFFHGNPHVYDSTAINEVVHKTFGELYNKTQQKRNNILNAGYNLVEIWESDYKNNIKAA